MAVGAYACADCGRDFDGVYMVHDWLWARYAGAARHLCPPCLGKRAGRPLTQADLIDAPCNTLWFPTDDALQNCRYL